MVERMPKRRYAYFRDDQIMVMVTHDDPLTPEQLQEFVVAIDEPLKRSKVGKITETPEPFSFPALKVDNPDSNPEELRILETSLKNEEQNQGLKELDNLANLLQHKAVSDDFPAWKEVKDLLKNENLQSLLLVEVENRKRLLIESNPSRTDEPNLFDTPYSFLLLKVNGSHDDPASFLNNISEFGRELSTKRFGAFRVEDVSPNWLMSVASQGGATGGPGALPMPFETKGDPPPYDFRQLREALGGLYGEGEQVDVAILDTAPSDHELVFAANTWPEHPLIKGLLGPSGKLRPYHATYSALQRMGRTSINQHDYRMTNHGLFAAGIVHNIVPEAKIHLIEVLNEFGVGDLAALYEGLAIAYNQVYDPESDRRLVVNCSWMLELPLSDLHCRAADEDPEYDFEQAIRQFVAKEKKQLLILRTICNNLALAGAQVVAAAGNDRQYAKKRRERKIQKAKEGVIPDNIDRWIDFLLEYLREKTPEARYPAAFASVIGVGALPKGPKRKLPTNKYEASNYSNLGDKPAGDAIMTLGGEEGQDETGKNKGVLGLYLGNEFPRVIDTPILEEPHKRRIEMYTVQRDHCWAWWAGTSFAAPIVTGAIAAVLSGKRLRRTQQAVQALREKGIVEDIGTNAQEDVMYVKQGPPTV